MILIGFANMFGINDQQRMPLAISRFKQRIANLVGTRGYWWLRTRLAIIRVDLIHWRLNRAAGRGGKVRVVFVVADLAIWETFASLYSRLSRLEKFSVSVVAFRRIDVKTTVEAESTRKFFEAQSVDYSFLESETEVNSFRWDLCDFAFFTLGEGAFPANLKIGNASRYCRTIYMAYGALLGDHFDYQYNSNSQHLAWRILAATMEEVRNYRSVARRPNSRVVYAGYSKFESMASERAGQATPARPQVLWAPHWTVGNADHNRFGSFDQFAMPMLDVLRNWRCLDFVLIAHPNLRHELGNRSLMSEIEFSDYLREYSSEPNGKLAGVESTAKLFVSSSAMISDSISFLADYLFTGNPLLFMNRRDRRRLNPTGELVIGAHYHGFSIAEVDEFLKMLTDTTLDVNKTKRDALRRLIWEEDAPQPSDVVYQMLFQSVSS